MWDPARNRIIMLQKGASDSSLQDWLKVQSISVSISRSNLGVIHFIAQVICSRESWVRTNMTAATQLSEGPEGECAYICRYGVVKGV